MEQERKIKASDIENSNREHKAQTVRRNMLRQIENAEIEVLVEQSIEKSLRKANRRSEERNELHFAGMKSASKQSSKGHWNSA
ncbi:MAG: hypothetical protein KGI06_02160 [Candidatus Micrarchaeota archaeon]|nr:hypothetical protein [Candidatus Micrarchaeota archaeon]